MMSTMTELFLFSNLFGSRAKTGPLQVKDEPYFRKGKMETVVDIFDSFCTCARRKNGNSVT